MFKAGSVCAPAHVVKVKKSQRQLVTSHRNHGGSNIFEYWHVNDMKWKLMCFLCVHLVSVMMQGDDDV